MSDNWREVQFRVRCTAASAVFLVLVFISIWAVATDVSVTIQIAQLPDYLDPAKISTFEEKLICGAVYETLLDYDPESGISKGALAEQWKVDATGTVYTFTLRKEACFHNSKTVSAGDVKFSWERLSDPETSGYGYLLNNVQGAKDVLNGKCSHLEGIKIVNAHTLQVTLLEPDYTFP
ncbi:MAG: ABC transporter substrate-binding protein, partial [Syntrophaceticus schinkii]|nr:ABC transporter substrate-binding protein [Syntrophaceticus schinkii]